MLIERPPLLYRMLFPETLWRIHKREHTVYLTFDDGPIPEVTPWVLDTLDEYEVKATFFLVGENVERHPELFEEIKRRGHSYGNHTMNHMRGTHVTTETYVANVERAAELVPTNLFRPPHGLMRPGQSRALREKYDIIMYDLVTRDYDRDLHPEVVLNNVRRFVRNGSIIVFHDSIKAERNLRFALPRAIEWLKQQGYELAAIPMR